ncbi:MAG: DUF1738 domain-containing protein [Gammaproteobacteria bacterium]|nr:DUF1738 domain-containing protein [Gammaproteobacteria bacterium]
MDRKSAFHELVAQRLIEQLKAGIAPWQKPWLPGEANSYLPLNPTTGKRYKGINAMFLMSQGRSDSRWLTYKQAAGVAAQVRKGEKGTPVQYWKFSEEQDQVDNQGRPVRDANGDKVKITVMLERPRVFFATVFNAEQIDGLPPLQRKDPPEQQWTAIERAEHILQGSAAVITHTPGDRAFYRYSTDSITLPEKRQFPSADRYYATALHELGHWTGHPSRLVRDLAHPFGSDGYAREELRAEIASMILGDELGIGHDPDQHAAYVGSWIKVLQEDPLEIFRASADAEKIQNYILAFEKKQIQAQSTTQTQEVGMMEQMDHIVETTEDRKAAEALAMLNDADLRHRIVEQERRARERQPQVDEPSREQPELAYITVPFREKDEAKALGARWDGQARAWYVPTGMDTAPFAKWAREAAVQAQAPVDSSQGEKVGQARLYLAVPYVERSAAKTAGALWDKSAKSWYAGPKADMEKLQCWFPDNVASPQGPAMTPGEEFAEALRSVGCLVSGEHPMMDSKRHRIAAEGDKSGEKAGFYIGHLDGHPAGYIKNNRTGIVIKWKSKGYSLDHQEKAKLQAEAASKLAARAAEQARLHEATAQRVSRQAKSLVSVVEPTPYLRDKGIRPQAGALTDTEGKKTYVPATDAAGKQWTMQYIWEDGTKRFAKDSRKEGCFHAVGGINAVAAAPALIIAEGYATATTLAEALGHGTVAAFDAGNLIAVAQSLHEKFPDKSIIIAGDDDRQLKMTQGINSGKMKAQEAAKAVGGKAIFPVFAPGENDYPSGLDPITPETYRAHLRATKTLADAQKAPDRNQLTDERVDALKRALLSDGQLAALSQMKRHTDFNDLANNSELGRAGVERQVRTAVSMAIDKAEPKREQQQAQRRSARIG